jgi:hypothetical protein
MSHYTTYNHCWYIDTSRDLGSKRDNASYYVSREEKEEPGLSYVRRLFNARATKRYPMVLGISCGCGQSPGFSDGLVEQGLANSNKSSLTASLTYRFQYETRPVIRATKLSSMTGCDLTSLFLRKVVAQYLLALMNIAP